MRIPFNRPVVGSDLESLRDELGLAAHEAQCLLGISAHAWNRFVSQEPWEPLPHNYASVALLVRLYADHPELAQNQSFTDVRALRERLGMNKRAVSLMLGREGTAGHRWERGSEEDAMSPGSGKPSSYVARLAYILNQIADMPGVLDDYLAIVNEESRARGVENIWSAGSWRTPAQRAGEFDVSEKSHNTLAPTTGMTHGDIPTNRPVVGSDLESLRDELGLAVQETQCLLGITAHAWNRFVSRSPWEPLPHNYAAVALLTRLYMRHPELAQTPSMVDMRALRERLGMNKRAVSLMLGREATACHRWERAQEDEDGEAQARPSGHVTRLAHLLNQIADMPRVLEDYIEIVNEESQARGVANLWSEGSWKPGNKKARERAEREARGSKTRKQAEGPRRTKRITDE